MYDMHQSDDLIDYFHEFTALAIVLARSRLQGHGNSSLSIFRLSFILISESKQLEFWNHLFNNLQRQKKTCFGEMASLGDIGRIRTTYHQLSETKHFVLTFGKIDQFVQFK